DALAAVLQLLAGDLQIDHQVAIDLAGLHHGRGADGVQDDLGRRAGFHPRRPDDDLWTDERRDHHVVRLDELHGRIDAQQEADAGAAFARALERAVHEWDGTQYADA